MLDKPIAIVDIETTGISSARERIIEIAVIKVVGGDVAEEFTSLVNPGKYIPKEITRITGISQNDIEDAPYFDEIAGRLDDIFRDSYFLAHNVIFDFSFVKRQMDALGFRFRPKLLCSVKLSRALYAQHKGHSLEKIITRHGIQTASRHRAYDDAKAVMDFMEIAANDHGPEAVQTALRSQLKLKSLPHNFDESYLEGVDNSPGVYIFKNMDDTPVYIGKSVTLRNRILSHFNQSSVHDREMKLSQSTHKLEVIKTDSELEALLLESKMIKQQLPIYNRMLRRKRTRTILLRETDEDGYCRIKMLDADLSEFDKPDSIFGVYDTRAKAKQAILKARDDYDLCSKLLGLEKAKTGCFYSQLGKCKGACSGKEPAALYNVRFDIAFERSRIQSWKYKHPILIRLSQFKGLVIDQWMIIAVVAQFDDDTPDITKVEASFDLDTYKILQAYISKHRENLMPFKAAV